MMREESVYGLVGYPVRHSFSGLMHNAAFRVCGISACYRLFEVRPQDLSSFLLQPESKITDVDGGELRACRVRGFNVTIPHKVAAYRLLRSARSGPEAAAGASCPAVDISGAVNTVKRENKLLYYNTDVTGFLRSLSEWGFDKASARVMLLGCGGAGRAVVAALFGSGPVCDKVYIYENNPDCVKEAKIYFSRFEKLAARCEFIDVSAMAESIGRSSLLVNATGIGMHENDVSPVNPDFLHKNLRVYDLVYNRKTPLLADAQRRGCLTSDGLNMLLYQGVEAWEIWMGRKAPVEIMRQALMQKIRQV